MSDEAGKSPVHGVSQGSSAGGSVPVYNCHARLSTPDVEGWITAHCCNLPQIVVRGKTQREALAALVAEFKAAISRYGAAGQAIPWAEAPAEPQPGEQERWIAVHL
jgi:hypothetical protein